MTISKRVRYGIFAAAALAALTPWLLLLRQPDYLESSGLRYRLLPVAAAFGEPVAWAADGEQLAFAQRSLWNQISVFDLRRGRTTALTSLASDCSAPFWASDGRSVYFFSASNGDRALWQAGIDGAAPKLIQEHLGGVSSLGGGAISPDGHTLALWRQEGKGNGAIQSVWMFGSPSGKLTKYRPSPFEQLPRLQRVRLAYNARGTQLALLAVPKQGASQLWSLPWPAGHPKRLFEELESIQDVSWLPEDRLLLTVGGRLWTADLESGALLPMTTGETREARAAAEPFARRIALSLPAMTTDAVSLPDAMALPFSGGRESAPVRSPGRDAIAYVSGGIYLAVSNGTSRTLVPSEPGIQYEWLAFSPDGKWLSYTRLAAKTTQVWAVRREGGAPVRVTANELNARAASWSPDGLWLTFRTSRAGMIYVEKAPFGGSQATTTLTTASDAAAPQWSPAGEWIAFLQSDGVWILSPDKEKKLKRLLLAAAPDTVEASGWSRDGKTLFVIVRTAADAQLLAIDADSGSAKLVRALPPDRWHSASGGMAFLDTDAEGIYGTRLRDRSEIWLLEGFDLPHGWWRRLWR